MDRGRGGARLAGAVLLELLFPGRCLVCGRRLLFEAAAGRVEPVCASCLSALPPLSGRLCRVCGAPLLSEQDTCLPCRERTFSFRSHRALFEYRGIVKDLLYQYKFQRRRRLAPLFSRLLAEGLQRLHPGLPVVPVPSRTGPFLSEGGHHLERIVRLLERRHGRTVWRLLRRRGGVPQKGLGAEERRRNIRGAISLVPHPDPSWRAPAIVLLDDVFTTGATADECARVLAGAGFAEVHALTLALD